MGADVRTIVAPPAGPEPWGDVWIRGGALRAVDVSPEEVPGLIDELPLLGVLASRATGVTRVTGAKELRVKESDRIAGVVTGLRALGADATELDDGFVVRGPATLRGGAADAEGDHRLAMAFAVAALAADGPVRIDGMDSVADSFPGFREVLEELR
jgi:3-phosphoshikimate 1-carboxyvinyltransferase